VKAKVDTARLEDINEVFARMPDGNVEKRVVLHFGKCKREANGFERAGPPCWR